MQQRVPVILEEAETNSVKMILSGQKEERERMSRILKPRIESGKTMKKKKKNYLSANNQFRVGYNNIIIIILAN